MRVDRLLTEDMLESIDEVLTSTPATRAEFDSNKYVQSHVLRHIQIIGETSWRVSKTIKDANPSIPWGAIAGMRHAIVHDYFEVDWNIVWKVTQEHIPQLKPQIEANLATLPPDP